MLTLSILLLKLNNIFSSTFVYVLIYTRWLWSIYIADFFFLLHLFHHWTATQWTENIWIYREIRRHVNAKRPTYALRTAFFLFWINTNYYSFAWPGESEKKFVYHCNYSHKIQFLNYRKILNNIVSAGIRHFLPNRAVLGCPKIATVLLQIFEVREWNRQSD